MDNQHKLISGYRDLSKEEIDTINEIKYLATKVGDLIIKVQTIQDVDQRWAAIGKTDLQTGFMALTRAVAKPTTF